MDGSGGGKLPANSSPGAPNTQQQRARLGKIIPMNPDVFVFGIYQQHRDYGRDTALVPFKRRGQELIQAAKLLERRGGNERTTRMWNIPFLRYKWQQQGRGQNPIYDPHIDPMAEPEKLLRDDNGNSIWHKIGSTWTLFERRQNGYKDGYFGVVWDFSQTTCRFDGKTYTLEQWQNTRTQYGKAVTRAVIEWIEKDCLQARFNADGFMEQVPGTSRRDLHEEIYGFTADALQSQVQQYILEIPESIITVTDSDTSKCYGPLRYIPRYHRMKITQIKIVCRMLQRIHWDEKNHIAQAHYDENATLYGSGPVAKKGGGSGMDTDDLLPSTQELTKEINKLKF
mgnify:CR=1 FL=1|tara:strand:+ start:62 stop:1081 length:1020 start_codon:yes stop_codon:yes gene_type:complete